jgi:hypothetical protein
VRLVIRIELDDNEIGIVREVVSTAESEVLRVGLTNGTVGELRGGMREKGIPPVEKNGGIATRRNWVATGTMTRRDWVKVVSTGTKQEVKQ